MGEFDFSWSALRDIGAEWLRPSRTMRRRLWPILIGLAYVLFHAAMGDSKGDYFVLGALPLLDAYNERTRLFLRYFLPFILTGVVYDSMRYFYWQGIAGHVHVAGPYYRDLNWFGMSEGGRRVTPNEYFAIHTSPVLDLLCGFAYLVFVGEYLLTAFYLFFRGRYDWLKLFGWSFFTVNVMGFVTYFIYPAAPPWYVTQYGLGPAQMHIAPNAAAAQRFDQMLGTHFFDQVYGRGVDVFGAYPSLHVAYPFLAAWICCELTEARYARPFAIAFYLLMCLSAVYLQHHYVVDILLGTLYSTIVYLVLRRLIRPRASLARLARGSLIA